MPISPAEGPGPWWDPLGLWQRTASGGDFTGAAQGLPPWWNVPQVFFDRLRSQLIGKAVSFGSGHHAVAFTVTSIEASFGRAAAASGQIDDVSLGADDVSWRGVRFERVSMRLRNYHTRFRTRPVIVAAPIDVSAVMTGEALGALLARVAPSWGCEITTGGELLLRRSGRPGWGHLRVQPQVEDGVLVLRPRAVGHGQRAWRLPRWVLPVRRRLGLPAQVRLTGVDMGAGELVIHLRVDERTVDVLDLLAWARRSG